MSWNLDFSRRDHCPMCGGRAWDQQEVTSGVYLGGRCKVCGPVRRCEGCGAWGDVCWSDCQQKHDRITLPTPWMRLREVSYQGRAQLCDCDECRLFRHDHAPWSRSGQKIVPVDRDVREGQAVFVRVDPAPGTEIDKARAELVQRIAAAARIPVKYLQGQSCGAEYRIDWRDQPGLVDGGYRIKCRLCPEHGGPHLAEDLSGSTKEWDG